MLLMEKWWGLGMALKFVALNLWFEYVGSRCQLILEDVNSLNKAVIHPKDTLQQKISPTSGKAASKLLTGISHVDSLSLDVYIIQVETYSL